MDKNNNILILCIHGLGGRAAWFDNLVKAVADLDCKGKKISFQRLDLLGFGANEPRGHVNHYRNWLDQCQSEYEQLKTQNPNKRIVILGHSLGAVITTNLYEIYPEDDVILSVPGFKGHAQTFNPLFVLRVVLTKLFAPKSFIDLPASTKTAGGYINGSFTTDDPSAWDELRTFRVTANLLWQVKELTEQSEKSIQRLKSRVLMLQAEQDTVVDNATQIKFFELIKNPEKEFYLIKNSLHDWIWYDQVQTVAKKIVDWL